MRGGDGGGFLLLLLSRLQRKMGAQNACAKLGGRGKGEGTWQRVGRRKCWVLARKERERPSAHKEAGWVGRGGAEEELDFTFSPSPSEAGEGGGS